MQSNPLTYRSYCWSQASPLIVVPFCNNGCVITLIKTNFLSYCTKEKKPIYFITRKKKNKKETLFYCTKEKKNERNKKEILL